MVRIGTILLVTLAALVVAAAQPSGARRRALPGPRKSHLEPQGSLPLRRGMVPGQGNPSEAPARNRALQSDISATPRQRFTTLSPPWRAWTRTCPASCPRQPTGGPRHPGVQEPGDGAEHRAGGRPVWRRGGLCPPRDTDHRFGQGGPVRSQEPRLKDYKPYLDNILRMKAHTTRPGGRETHGPGQRPDGRVRRFHLFHLHQCGPPLPQGREAPVRRSHPHSWTRRPTRSTASCRTARTATSFSRRSGRPTTLTSGPSAPRSTPSSRTTWPSRM